MISQLLATIMMALGVASGTKATSNTFYDAEKPIQKAVENYDEEITYALASEWHNQNYETEYKKYYLHNQAVQNQSSTYVADNMLIYNSTYTFEQPDPYNNSRYRLDTYGIYKIQNIYNGIAQFDISEVVNLNSYLVQAKYGSYTSTDTKTDELIDMTMTQGTYDTFMTKLNGLQKTQLTNEDIQYGNTYVETLEGSTTTITLTENQIIYILIYIYAVCSNTGNNPGDIILSNFTMQGTYQAPNYTYEVVDLPGVMFSVLSMPFAFISTAFNLTIFPNTPYQLNFANLFMVILAAFILMWLIKKVFH